MMLSRICGVLVLGLGLGLSAGALADELVERDTMMHLVRDLAWRQDFAELEAMSERYRVEKSRTSSGLWKLGLFHGGISAFVDSCATHCDDILRNWMATYPDSPTARLAQAQLFITVAWEHRGSGYGNEVKEEAWKPFYDNIAKARGYLEAYKQIASVDPTWYEMMATVARAEGWPAHEFSAMINEGLDRAPDYYPLYFSAIEYYAPKWRGSAQEIEDFARAAVKRTRAAEGFGLYARIYWYASEIQYDENLFMDSNVAWIDMKAGIDDVLKQYPDDWNLNHFAKFACLAGDYAKAAELIDRLESEPMPYVWGPSWYLERCQFMAMLGL